MCRPQSERIIDYLHQNKLYWFAQLRADYLAKRFYEWKDKHMAGALTAIESLNQNTLDSINKKEEINDILRLIKDIIAHNKMITSAYMIGFESDTVDSIKREIKEIAKLKMDICQICIVTPLPLTPLWDEIDSKYGIFDKDWHHYNVKHLVWNHPHISSEEMREVLHWSFKTLYPPTRPLETIYRFIYKYLTTDGTVSGINYMIRKFFHNNSFEFNPEQTRFLDKTPFNNTMDTNVTLAHKQKKVSY